MSIPKLYLTAKQQRQKKNKAMCKKGGLNKTLAKKHEKKFSGLLMIKKKKKYSVRITSILKKKGL